MKMLTHLRCIKCLKKSKKKKLFKNKNFLLCKTCGECYPFYKKTPILLSFENDFFHLKKALTPAKYRVRKYGN